MLNNLRAERLKRNLTLQQVADEIGVHPNAVNRWEMEKADPSSRNLMSLCKLYKCSPEYLLDMTDDRNGSVVAS